MNQRNERKTGRDREETHGRRPIGGAGSGGTANRDAGAWQGLGVASGVGGTDMAARKMVLEAPVKSSRTNATGGTRVLSRPAPLDDAAKLNLYRRWRQGVSRDVLAQQQGRSV